jgi:hypothetical protein
MPAIADIKNEVSADKYKILEELEKRLQLVEAKLAQRG